MEDRKTVLTLKSVEKLVRQHGGRCLSDRNAGPGAPLAWACRNGHNFLASLERVARGHWCRDCLNEERKTHSFVPVDSKLKPTSELQIELGRIVRHERIIRDISQSQVGEQLGISQSAISKIENGLLSLSATEWLQFCRWLSISPWAPIEALEQKKQSTLRGGVKAA